MYLLGFCTYRYRSIQFRPQLVMSKSRLYQWYEQEPNCCIWLVCPHRHGETVRCPYLFCQYSFPYFFSKLALILGTFEIIGKTQSACSVTGKNFLLRGEFNVIIINVLCFSAIYLENTHRLHLILAYYYAFCVFCQSVILTDECNIQLL